MARGERTYTERNATLADFEFPDSSHIERLIVMEAIMNPELIPDIAQKVRPEDFSSDTVRRIWDEINQTWQSKKGINIACIVEPLPPKERTELISQAAKASSSALQILQHADTLSEIATRKAAYLCSLEILKKASNPGNDHTPIADLLDESAKKIRERSQVAGLGIKAIMAIEHLAEEMQRQQERRMENKAVKVTTGWRELDEILCGGFDAGELIILAARPSVGKTALMLQMAESAATSGTPVYLFSLEMTVTQIAKRMALSKETMDPVRLSNGDPEWDKFSEIETYYQSMPLYIDDDGGATIHDIRARLTLAHQQGKCEMAMIDYLGLIKGSQNGTNLYQTIAEYSAKIKALAKALKIPIVLLCQLNRASASEGRPPQLYDLRDSGSIEQDADTVLMLERVDYDIDSWGVKLWIRKNRNGNAGNKFIVLRSNPTHTWHTVDLEKSGLLNKNNTPIQTDGELNNIEQWEK